MPTDELDAISPHAGPDLDEYEVCGEGHAWFEGELRGQCRLVLYSISADEALFFARDTAGNNHTLVIRPGATRALDFPGLEGWSVGVLCVRPRDATFRDWAVVRVFRTGLS